MGDRGFDTIGRKLLADVLFACKQYEGTSTQPCLQPRLPMTQSTDALGAKRSYMLCLDAQPINGRLWHRLSECYDHLSVSPSSPWLMLLANICCQHVLPVCGLF